MIKSEKRRSILCARALKRSAAAMPRWTGVVPLASRRRVEETGRQGAGGKVDAKWRRVTGMTVSIEPFMDRRERRAGLKRLVKWLKKRTRRGDGETRGGRAALGLKSGVQRSENGFRPVAPGGGVHGGMLDGLDLEAGVGRDMFVQTGMSAPLDGGSVPLDGRSAPLNGGSVPLDGRSAPSSMPRRLRAVGEWAIPLEEWAAVRERSWVESICGELGISLSGLSRLTREQCGLSAQELIDGFNIGRLRHALLEKCREAARALWGVPGEYAKSRCLEPRRSLLTEDGDFFRHEQKLFEETEEESIERRMSDILGLLRGIDLDVLAMKHGFGNSARLKRACLNVIGSSFKRVMETMARDVLDYYLCAEQKALRDLASREPASGMVMRARMLYWDDEKTPTAPFLDRWSAAEFGAAEWLRGMSDAFG